MIHLLPTTVARHRGGKAVAPRPRQGQRQQGQEGREEGGGRRVQWIQQQQWGRRRGEQRWQQGGQWWGQEQEVVAHVALLDTGRRGQQEEGEQSINRTSLITHRCNQ